MRAAGRRGPGRGLVGALLGLAFRDALAAAGTPADYVCYSGEGHLINQPAHQADLLRRTLAWFDCHLRTAG